MWAKLVLRNMLLLLWLFNLLLFFCLLYFFTFPLFGGGERLQNGGLKSATEKDYKEIFVNKNFNQYLFLKG